MKRLTLYVLISGLLLSFPWIVTAEEKSKTSLNEEIIYDIVIDRFNNGNQQKSEQVRTDDPYAYHGGDFQGIIMKLDDIKNLGFTTITLSPVMANAKDGFHGYWIEDFYEVDEQFGTMEDLKQLVEEAHKREIKVILEMVPNYIAKTHPISKKTEQQDWIDQDKEINDDEEPWLKEAVALNQSHPEVVDYLIDVAEFWITETNVDGLKIHAADKANQDFLKTYTTKLKSNHPELILLANVSSEVNIDAFTDMTFDLIENKNVQKTLSDVLSTVNEPISRVYDVWKDVGNQHTLIQIDDKFSERFTHKFSEAGRNIVTAWKLALTYMYTTPGVPYIYQGSEIPMYGKSYPEMMYLMQFNSGEPEVKEYFTQIASLRQQFPALQHGDFDMVSIDKGMSVFKRSYQDETLYIVINNDNESRQATLTEIDTKNQLRGLLGDDLVRANQDGEFKIGISRESQEVYIVEENSGINWLFIVPIALVFLLFVGSVIHLSRKQKQQA
ncbi:MAG TPA: alpha-amylase family glycosyl hydrolase [Cerasibacillus sp.]|uniref:alpha-amylase family glycosyl hydrolase n=1 Tax=Cerasibacillus sp. TaxID=2498711 RepID=UPI002F40395F